MWECSCGFINDDATRACLACGSPSPAPAETPGSLVLVNMSTRQRIEVKRPGGIIGRAGDFEPDSFSPRVSRMHLVAEAHDGKPWTLEFIGRHKTELDAAGVWAPMERDMPREVVGGEKLRMADMLFRIEVLPENAAPAFPTGCIPEPLPCEESPHPAQDNACDASPCAEDACDDGLEETSDAYEARDEPDDRADDDDGPRQIGWVVRCPVCGTAYPVQGPEDRIAACSACFDPMDAREIARCAPQPTFA